MNEKERSIHKERRKKQKRRRKVRQREAKQQSRIADRCQRIERDTERIIQKRVEQGEFIKIAKSDKQIDMPRPSASMNGCGKQKSSVSGEKVECATERRANSRKRTGTNNQEQGFASKASRADLAPGAGLKEINPFHVTVNATHVGTGSYGSCYLGSYRGLDVVVKQLKVKQLKGETPKEAQRRVKEELRYEARIINRLGDHPGLPLLFGICSVNAPYRLIIQFHGEKNCNASFTISSGLSKRSISEISVWRDIVRKVAEALRHVHNTGFLHNDLKGNNVVLDNREGNYNPVLIDFGKSLPMNGLKGPKDLSTEQQAKYMKEFPHIAPEIVTGKQGQSIASDIFSLAIMVKTIFAKARLGGPPEVIQKASHSNPAKRPSLKKIIELL